MIFRTETFKIMRSGSFGSLKKETAQHRTHKTCPKLIIKWIKTKKEKKCVHQEKKWGFKKPHWAQMS